MEDILSILENYIASKNSDDYNEELELLLRAVSEIKSLRAIKETLIEVIADRNKKIERAQMFVPASIFDMSDEDVNDAKVVMDALVGRGDLDFSALLKDTALIEQEQAQAASDLVDQVLGYGTLCICGTPHGKKVEPNVMVTFCDDCLSALEESIDPYDGDN